MNRALSSVIVGGGEYGEMWSSNLIFRACAFRGFCIVGGGMSM